MKQKKLTVIAKESTMCEYELSVDAKGDVYAVHHDSDYPIATAKEIDGVALVVRALMVAEKLVGKISKLTHTGGGHELRVMPDSEILGYISVGCQNIDYGDVIKIQAASLKARGIKSKK